MNIEAIITLAVLAGVLGLLVFTQIATDIVLLAGVTILLLTGVINSQDALAGLSNEGMVAVGVLYIIVAGLESTGATAMIVRRLLGQPKSLTSAHLKMCIPVSFVSAFLNNTPVVAMFMPAVTDWAKKYRLSVSKLMIPLSYAAILGGTCTLIGTSTNLVVYGLNKKAGYPDIGMWDIAWVGVPSAVIGSIYLVFFSRWLLPDRVPLMQQLSDPREYMIEMMVEPGSPLVGQSIEGAGLRHLPNLFLAEIERGGDILPAVAPTERLEANDRLVFTGVVESVLDLQRIRGLTPATNQVFKLDAPRRKRTLIEAVVSNTCPMIGKTIRETKFRTIYNAVVIAVARNGRRINKKIGDIELEAGDTLLVEAPPTFIEQHHNSRHFFLISRVENSTPIRHEQAFIAIGILCAMIAAVTGGWLSMLQAAMLAAGLMLVARCCTSSEARKAVDWPILIAIAASLALGAAMEKTGLAKQLADAVLKAVDDAPGGVPWRTLAAIYGVTMLLTSLISHSAAAAIVFPIAHSTADSLGVNAHPFVMAIMMAASASLATPMSYQTNLMVMNAGGYRFMDYVRCGLPLNLLLWAISVAIIPWAYPFR